MFPFLSDSSCHTFRRMWLNIITTITLYLLLFSNYLSIIMKANLCLFKYIYIYEWFHKCGRISFRWILFLVVHHVRIYYFQKEVVNANNNYSNRYSINNTILMVTMLIIAMILIFFFKIKPCNYFALSTGTSHFKT